MSDQEQPTALAEATLVFDNWTTPPLTENQRMLHRQRSPIVRVVRRLTAFKAREAKLADLGACRASLTWYVATKHRRDADNIVPTLKAMCDGLVDAGVVVDDIPQLMDKPMPRIVYEAGGTPRLELHVEKIAAPTPAPTTSEAGVVILDHRLTVPVSDETAQVIDDVLQMHMPEMLEEAALRGVNLAQIARPVYERVVTREELQAALDAARPAGGAHG